MITLNQEEIQLACKRFVKQQYNLDTPTDDSRNGIVIKVVSHPSRRGVVMIEADVEVLKAQVAER